MKKRGTFIVIDGIDGVGKATQTELLVERLHREKIKVKKIDFPRYYNNVFGKLIGECLAGKRGAFIEMDPKISSVLYAADRFESKQEMEKWLDDGYVVVADRFVSANQIHQGGKIKNTKDKKDFLNWLDTIEHKIFKVPRPDVIVYLSLPVSLSTLLLSRKSVQEKKKYLEGRKDLAESDIKHLEDSRRSVIDIIKKNNNWIKIECSKSGEILPREVISDQIYSSVKKYIKNNAYGKNKTTR
jgi:dTMP kinase